MKKVMIVDDDKFFLDEITEMLRTGGYDITPVLESRHAVNEAIRLKPDVILLDLRIEGVSGFAIADELRSVKDTKNIPVIAITGVYTDKEYDFLIRSCGMKTCITKPFTPLDIINAIENYTSTNKSST